MSFINNTIPKIVPIENNNQPKGLNLCENKNLDFIINYGANYTSAYSGIFEIVSQKQNLGKTSYLCRY